MSDYPTVQQNTQENDPPFLEQAFKQFYLESERVESVFTSLQEQFKSIQTDLQETHTKLYGKLVELDFVSHYLDAILNHISQGILFIDMQGMITTCNPSANTILGIKNGEILFHSFWDLFSDEALGFSLKEALKDKKSPKINFTTWTTSEGVSLDLEIETTFVESGTHVCPIGSIVPTHQAFVQGLLVLIRNVTEIRRLQFLANRNERLKELGELAALAAHEIRNPLGGIKGFANLLKQDLEGQPTLQHMATSIVEGTEELNRFVNRVLNYTRPFQPRFELLNLVPFLQDMLNLIKADKAFHSQISCSFSSTTPQLVVPIDSSLFRSAILNLLVNALQAMPQGGELSVDLNHDQVYAYIRIKDTGLGIPSEDLNKIFSPLFTTKESGNGFGLAEVYRVVQAHQGSIEVQSQKNCGALFIIKIPLKLS